MCEFHAVWQRCRQNAEKLQLSAGSHLRDSKRTVKFTCIVAKIGRVVRHSVPLVVMKSSVFVVKSQAYSYIIKKLPSLPVLPLNKDRGRGWLITCAYYSNRETVDGAPQRLRVSRLYAGNGGARLNMLLIQTVANIVHIIAVLCLISMSYIRQ